MSQIKMAVELSENAKKEIRKELDKENSHGAGFRYDCLNCSHSMSTEDNELICVVSEVHKQVNENHLCPNWN